MKNKSIIAITLIALISLSATYISAYSNNPYSAPSSAKSYGGHSKTTKGKQKTKKPEYYRPGKSDGLQNWPGKTIDAGANTGMLSTNSSSPLMGNDITF